MKSLSYEDLKALVLLNRFGGRRSVLDLLEQGLAPSEVVERLKAGIAPSAEGIAEKRPVSISSCHSEEGRSPDEGSQGFFAQAFRSPRRGSLGTTIKEALAGKTAFDPGKEIEGCEKLGVRLLTWFDSDYPRLLKEIHDPPLVLYSAGHFEESDEAAVAVVGTRHPGFYGMTQAKKFSRELAAAGITIVSGFAKGIDQAAHEAALSVRYGRTVAVLGCGLDVEYPRGSRKLFETVKERGAVISEYPLGTAPRAENFPRRNRIISGLALGVLVVEAHIRSGSLITAHQAAEQGRDVFAIPGPVDQLGSAGTHLLIKEGAALVEKPFDILESLAPQIATVFVAPAAVPKNQDGPTESARTAKPEGGDPGRTEDQESDSILAILRALSEGPLSYEELAVQSGVSAAAFVSSLTILELKRRIRKSPDGRFDLCSPR